MKDRIHYYIYKDYEFMKSIYTQIFDELPDIGTIEYIGSKSVNSRVDYSVIGDRESSKNKNFEIEESEKNINRNFKNQIRGDIGFSNSYGENVIRIYANIEDVKNMVNNGLYNDILEKVANTKCGKYNDLIKLTGKLELYSNYENQEDIFLKLNKSVVWVKKILLDTDIKVLTMILDKITVIGYIVREETTSSPTIIKAIAIYK